MEVSVFTEKLNKVEGNVYVMEEEAHLTDGVYEAELAHDNVNVATLSVYTGPKLTGERIQSYTLSTPSMTPWKKIIRIFGAAPLVYISYETEGDTVEADDINRVQLCLTETQTALSDEVVRAETAEQSLHDGLADEVKRAKAVEKSLGDNLTAETARSTAKEAELQGNIDAHAMVVDGEVQGLWAAAAALEANKADVTYVNGEMGKRYTKEQVYTKEEVLRQIEGLIGSAPEVLDTFKEIADALGNDPDFAATMMGALAGKVDREAGKRLSTNDYTDEERAIVADVNDKKHAHGNKEILDKLTQTMLDNQESAFSHVGDTVRHVTPEERAAWGGGHDHDDAYLKKGAVAWNDLKGV